MATPLRYALIFLLWAMVAVIYAPLIPAALTLISPALSLTHWQALFADPQLPQALLATLVSTTIAAVGALLIALLVIVALWPGPKWQRMCTRLPWLLAIPHVAFATSALLLFADGGLLYDYFPYFTPPMDKLGIGLGFTLAVKESAFLLWILAAVLSEKRLLQQVIVLDSLGYSRWQCLNWLLLPSVAPALAMALGLACASSWAAELAKPLTLDQLQQQNGKAIDTRSSAFYNGWPQTLNGPSGHEPAALNLSAGWLDKMSTEQLNAWIKQHNLKADAPVALYGNGKDVDAVKTRLQKAGFTHISILSDALSEPSRLQKLPHFEQLVYPQWLHDLQQGKEVTAKPAGDWKVIEAARGAPKLYLISHIPGADYIDTNEVESEPLWNKVSDEQLKAMLAKHGIRHDTTVILYGRDVYAAARVAQIMLYAGVKDVRLLDGGWQTWSDAGLPVERGTPPKVKAEPDFGVKIPAQPQLMLDMEQARGLLHRQDASLVSIRSWPEFIGTTSGYSYIKPKGEIAGARWGHAGSDSTHMEDFHNPDGTMRSADDITAMWKAWNIKPDQQVSFYCGTGWRASETFMYARAMGWNNVSVYDGGWYEWSSDPKNPVATGERGPDSSK